MDTQEQMEERLWDYIDGICSEQERSFIEELIATNLEWKSKYGDLLDVHQVIQNSIELDQPSLRFRQNVMEEIAKYQIAPATKSYINKNIIRGIGAFFIVMVLGFIVSGFAQVNWVAESSGVRLPVDFSNLDWSKFFNNTYSNIFLMVNIVLGLMLLDMYLGEKKKQWQNKT